MTRTRTRFRQPGYRVDKTAWSSFYGCAMSEHFWLVNIITSNYLVTMYLLKLLMEFKSTLYLVCMAFTIQKHAFSKNYLCKIGDFYLQLLEINDKDQEPNIGSQIKEQVKWDQVMRTKLF